MLNNILFGGKLTFNLWNKIYKTSIYSIVYNENVIMLRREKYGI